MKNEKINIVNPALGCKVGVAYHTLLSTLSQTLDDAGLGISVNEYLILRAVYTKEGLQQCEIADMTGKDKTAVCRYVATMEKNGLVTTRCVSHKCREVYLTDKSRDIKTSVMAVAAKRHKALETLIGTEKLMIFNDILDTIIKSK